MAQRSSSLSNSLPVLQGFLSRVPKRHLVRHMAQKNLRSQEWLRNGWRTQVDQDSERRKAVVWIRSLSPDFHPLVFVVSVVFVEQARHPLISKEKVNKVGWIFWWFFVLDAPEGTFPKGTGEEVTNPVPVRSSASDRWKRSHLAIDASCWHR